MTQSFPQNVIAVIWDFDQTLIPGHMQVPLFREYGVDEHEFWEEVRALPDRYRQQGLAQISNEVFYLNHILDYVRQGRFAGLNNAKLRELGAQLEFHPGLPDFFDRLKRAVGTEKYREHDIRVEHYIVSTGLAQMIQGSALSGYIDGVWGCEFIDGEDSEELAAIGYVLDHTSKTRAVFEINKGCNFDPERIDVNAYMKPSERRVPIGQMIYIADGPSDVPVFSVVQTHGGRTYIVYNPESDEAYEQAYDLVHEERRADAMGKADYRPGSEAERWLLHTVEKIADAIVKRHTDHLVSNVGKAPGHLSG